MWSGQFPYLATSPDGIIHLGNTKFGILEVKCLYKQHNSFIEVGTLLSVYQNVQKI